MPTLGELARAVGGELHGPSDLEITGVASLEGGGDGDLAPLDSDPFLRAAETSGASAFLVSRKVSRRPERPHILADHALAALNRVIELLGLVKQPLQSGIHPTAVVDPSAEIGAGVSIGAYVVVEAGARIGARSTLRPHVVVERDVVLGEDCLVEPGAVLHVGTVAGDRVRVGAHAVISREGFGFAPGPEGPVLLHHIGRVVLEDDAHVGAATMVDRARFDETRLGRQCGLDNLVHIGHNATVGDRTHIAAQTGLAGNARVGNDCVVGGQVGVGNHCGVGDHSRVAAKTGVTSMFGDKVNLAWYPAFDRRDAWRMLSWLRRMAREERAARRRKRASRVE